MDLPRSLALLLLISLLAWYLSFSASRLDRLHHRVEGARSALDAQLVRRAEAAVELAASGAVDLASGLLLADAASRALEAGEHEPDAGRDAIPREQAESVLSQALRATVDAEVVARMREDAMLGALIQRLDESSHRVRLARRFLNDAVTDAVRVRRKLVVRWARLAGRAPIPRTFEMDDDPAAALAR